VPAVRALCGLLGRADFRWKQFAFQLLDTIISTEELRPQQPGPTANLTPIDRAVVDDEPSTAWRRISNVGVGAAGVYAAADVVFTTLDEGSESGLVDLIIYSESATIDGDNLICTPGGSGGTVLAVNKKTGKQVWRSKDFKDNAAYAPALVADIGGVHQIISYTQAHLAGIAAKDGAVLWVADRPGQTAVIPTPVVKDDYIFVTSGYKVGCDLFKINSSGGKFTPEKIYSNKDMQNHHGGVIGLDGNIYGHSDSKGWVCMDMLTGKVKWSDKGIGKGSIAYADGHFYLRSEGKAGTIALIDASPAGYKEHGKFDQPDRSDKQAWPHPVIANGKLYIRDMDTLLCYDVKAN